MTNNARHELAEALRSTDVISQLLADIEQEPLRLFCAVAGEHQRTGQPVPDHRLNIFGYLAEPALRALVSAGLLKLLQGGSYSIYEYEPTDRGQELYHRLRQEGDCK